MDMRPNSFRALEPLGKGSLYAYFRTENHKFIWLSILFFRAGVNQAGMDNNSGVLFQKTRASHSSNAE